MRERLQDLLDGGVHGEVVEVRVGIHPMKSFMKTYASICVRASTRQVSACRHVRGTVASDRWE